MHSFHTDLLDIKHSLSSILDIIQYIIYILLIEISETMTTKFVGHIVEQSRKMCASFCLLEI